MPKYKPNKIWIDADACPKAIKEYIVKGLTLDDERLSKPGEMDYFDELLDRIRAIRTSTNYSR